MSVLHELRLLARKVGVEVARYNPAHSQAARLAQLLAHHEINTVLDVGANDGDYGRMLRAGGYKGDILSFEPLEDPYRKLCDLAASDTHWQIAQRMALGSEDGEIEINVAGNLTSSSILSMENLHKEASPQSGYVGKETVQVHTLDSISHPMISSKKRTLLKIDTQGYEGKVLAGAENTLEFITGVQIELSLVPLYQGQLLYRELIDQLLEKGFLLWNVVPGFTDIRTGQMLQMDGVFYKIHEKK
jgi:FkbM family methyltransferase